MRAPQSSERAFSAHWEGNLINCAGNRSAVGFVVERSSHLVMLIKLADEAAASAPEVFIAKLHSVDEPMRETLNHDHRREIGRHTELSTNTGVVVYLSHPHRP